MAQFEIWEESRIRGGTFSGTWVLSLHDGKRRVARLVSRASRCEIERLQEQAKSSGLTTVAQLKQAAAAVFQCSFLGSLFFAIYKIISDTPSDNLAIPICCRSSPSKTETHKEGSC